MNQDKRKPIYEIWKVNSFDDREFVVMYYDREARDNELDRLQLAHPDTTFKKIDGYITVYGECPREYDVDPFRSFG